MERRNFVTAVAALPFAGIAMLTGKKSDGSQPPQYPQCQPPRPMSEVEL